MKTSRGNVGKHYDRNQVFYNLFWMNRKNLGMHYGFWEEETKSLHQAIINENQAIATALKVKQSDRVLDAGCGVGGTSLWLAEQYGARITGITLSQKQKEMAEEHAQRRGVSHLVDFEIRDFCDTNFSKESFDKIFGIESTCYAEDKRSFLKEAYRLLKPGGRIAIADFYINKPLDERGQQLVLDFCRGWEIPSLPSLDEIRQQMKESGFEKIEIFDKTKEIEPSSRRMFFVMGRLVRSGLKTLEFLKLRKGHGGTKATVSQYYMFQEGFATYNIVTAQKPTKG